MQVVTLTAEGCAGLHICLTELAFEHFHFFMLGRHLEMFNHSTRCLSSFSFDKNRTKNEIGVNRNGHSMNSNMSPIVPNSSQINTHFV